MLTRILLFLCCATPALADQDMLHDFTGNGASEHVRLIETKRGWQHLIIDSDTHGTTFIPRISQGDTMAGETSIAITPAGSLEIERAHLGIGRHKWILTVTVAFRNERFKIAGITYVYYDSLDTESGKTCDLNLLSGKGIFDRASGQKELFSFTGDAPNAHNWDVSTQFWGAKLFPEDCFG